MEMQIRVTDSKALARLRSIARVMSPDQRLLLNREAGIKMHQMVIDTFRAEGATQDRPQWQDLKAGGRWKRRMSKDGVLRRERFLDKRLPRDARGNFIKGSNLDSVYMILQDSGALREAYYTLADESHAGVGALSGKKHADIAAAHEYGVPSRNLPARPMLPTHEAAVAAVYAVYKLAVEAAAGS